MTTAPTDGPLDAIQESLAEYGTRISFADLPGEVVQAAKIRLIDTLGVLLAGFSGKPCRIARELAAPVARDEGATILGSRIVTTPDMAAFVNGTTARFLEYNDVYHYPGSAHGHPSDVIAPVFAAGEHVGASGRDLITGIVLGYEVYGYISDNFKNRTFDNSNYCCVATSVAAGRMLRLDKDALAHCISMAVLPNNVLRQVRRDRFTMWKEVASGHAGRAAVFAALLARGGMESPLRPFEGDMGWCDHIAGARFTLDKLGADFKILHTRTRHRPAMGEMHAAIFAAERIGPLTDPAAIKAVKVEVYERAKDLVGTGEEFWNPRTRETADHSIPYVVAASLLYGELIPRSFEDDRLWSTELRSLLPKIEVVENPDFTEAYHRVPREQRARVTVTMADGEQLVGEAGGGTDDLAAEKTDDEIIAKFRSLSEPLIGIGQVDALLDQLRGLEEIDNIATLPERMVIR